MAPEHTPSRNHLLQSTKPLGVYLVEAGLLSDAQVGVALADQSVTSLRFGEIVATRGWVKEKTVEYIMQKVVIPERMADAKSSKELEVGLIRQPPAEKHVSPYQTQPSGAPIAVRTSRIDKAKTSPPEDGVNWIG
jgi:hypothetical protein